MYLGYWLHIYQLAGLILCRNSMHKSSHDKIILKTKIWSFVEGDAINCSLFSLCQNAVLHKQYGGSGSCKHQEYYCLNFK